MLFFGFLLPVNVFFDWRCWHQVCLNYPWNWAYLGVYEVDGGIVVFSVEPETAILVSENVHGIV